MIFIDVLVVNVTTHFLKKTVLRVHDFRAMLLAMLPIITLNNYILHIHKELRHTLWISPFQT